MKKSKCERVVQVTDFRWSFLKKKIATKKMESTLDPDQKADEKDCEVVKVGKNIE